MREEHEAENQDNLSSSAMPKPRSYANERERLRTYSVNYAFATLRNLIPTDPADRKLSKIEILRLACSYITHLASILVTGYCENSATSEALLFDNHNFAEKSRICTFCIISTKLKFQ